MRLAERKNQLIARGVKNFIVTIAKEEGVSTSAIKQVLAKEASSFF